MLWTPKHGQTALKEGVALVFCSCMVLIPITGSLHGVFK